MPSNKLKTFATPQGVARTWCPEDVRPGSLKNIWAVPVEYILTMPRRGGITSDPVQLIQSASMKLYDSEKGNASLDRKPNKRGYYEYTVTGSYLGIDVDIFAELDRMGWRHFALILEFFTSAPPMMLGSPEYPMIFDPGDFSTDKLRSGALKGNWKFEGAAPPSAMPIFMDPTQPIPNEELLIIPRIQLNIDDSDLSNTRWHYDGSTWDGNSISANPDATFIATLEAFDPTGVMASPVDIVDITVQGGTGANSLVFDWLAPVDSTDQADIEAEISGLTAGAQRGVSFNKLILDGLLKGHDYLASGDYLATNSTGRNYYQEWGGAFRTDIGGDIEQEGMILRVKARVAFKSNISPTVTGSIRKGIKRIKILAPYMVGASVNEDFDGVVGSGEYRGHVDAINLDIQNDDFTIGENDFAMPAASSSEWFSPSSICVWEHSSDLSSLSTYAGGLQSNVSAVLAAGIHIARAGVSVKDGIDLNSELAYILPAATYSSGSGSYSADYFSVKMLAATAANNYQDLEVLMQAPGTTANPTQEMGVDYLDYDNNRTSRGSSASNTSAATLVSTIDLIDIRQGARIRVDMYGKWGGSITVNNQAAIVIGETF